MFAVEIYLSGFRPAAAMLDTLRYWLALLAKAIYLASRKKVSCSCVIKSV